MHHAIVQAPTLHPWNCPDVSQLVALLQHVASQDYRLAELMANTGCAVVIVANKWDRVANSPAGKNMTTEEYAKGVQANLRQIPWAPVICTTANKGRRVPEVVAAIQQAGEQHRRRVSTATLNLVVKEAVAWKAPPTMRGSSRQGRLYYGTQAGSKPPSFVFFVNDPKLFPDDYRR